MLDFSSPLKNWNEADRTKEALRYCDLTEADIKAPVLKEAMEYYEKLQTECCRPLKTYRAALKGMEAMDNYFDNINFTDVDKMGKLKFTPNQFIDNLAKTNKAYDELRKLETRVYTELEENTGIRGKAVMSDREIKYAKSKAILDSTEWNENYGDIPEGPKMIEIPDQFKPKEDNVS